MAMAKRPGMKPSANQMGMNSRAKAEPKVPGALGSTEANTTAYNQSVSPRHGFELNRGFLQSVGIHENEVNDLRHSVQSLSGFDC